MQHLLLSRYHSHISNNQYTLPFNFNDNSFLVNISNIGNAAKHRQNFFRAPFDVFIPPKSQSICSTMWLRWQNLSVLSSSAPLTVSSSLLAVPVAVASVSHYLFSVNNSRHFFSVNPSPIFYYDIFVFTVCAFVNSVIVSLFEPR